jgi:UDP-glucose 4-epimerase
MMKKKILITGGAWYIWSHAVVAFEQAGYQTIILDNFSNSSRETLLGIEKILWYCPPFFEYDIRDKWGIEVIFEKYDFDGVIHFAWIKAVGESCEKIAEYHENNIGGSMVLFTVMEKYGVTKIVFSSSATVYHFSNISPLTEEMPTGTTNPYGTTKLVIEKLLEDYARNAGWAVTSLRYFNPIGAHPSW